MSEITRLLTEEMEQLRREDRNREERLTQLLQQQREQHESLRKSVTDLQRQVAALLQAYER